MMTLAPALLAVAAVAMQPAPAAATPVPAPAVTSARPRCDSPLKLDLKSRALQRGLERALDTSRLERYTKRQRLAVAVVDLSRAEEIYYAGVNDDVMMYAASLPKIAILLALAQAAHDGRLAWTAEHDLRMTAMVTESSNPAATWGVEQVGLAGIESVLRDPRLCFYDEVHGGLWVGRHYAPGGDTYRDPVAGQSHGATARQAARFLALLSKRQLIDKGWSDHLLALMGPPKHQHKFVRGLLDRDGVTFLARKSGTWRHWHSDAALVQHGEDRYVAVALSELRNGDEVIQEVIRLVDDLVTSGKHRRPRTPQQAVRPALPPPLGRG